jgi:hypothetical protein
MKREKTIHTLPAYENFSAAIYASSVFDSNSNRYPVLFTNIEIQVRNKYAWSLFLRLLKTIYPSKSKADILKIIAAKRKVRI